MHLSHRHSAEHHSEVPDDLARVVVRDVRAPSDPNAICSVHKDSGQDGTVPFRFDNEAFIVQVLEHVIVVWMEEDAGHWAKPGVDVARSRVVLSALQPCTKLTGGNQKVRVVGTHKVLCQVDDGVLQRNLAVMIGRLLRDVADKLRHLDVVAQFLLEGAEQNLALRGLEAIHQGWDGPLHVVLGKLHELLVDEIRVANGATSVVHIGAILVAIDPILAIIRTLLVERQVNGLTVLLPCPFELDLVLLDVPEVFLSLLRGARAKTFVVLGLEALPFLLCFPGLVLVH
mmetsp:Transcript_48734/g.87596  ORF Transcript_48734/g.87596 Transcript_48734/m.87596 type:complete len:286 (-) Transcript_48734:1818-2675(-)